MFLAHLPADFDYRDTFYIIIIVRRNSVAHTRGQPSPLVVVAHGLLSLLLFFLRFENGVNIARGRRVVSAQKKKIKYDTCKRAKQTY